MFDGADMMDIHKLRAFVAVVEESHIVEIIGRKIGIADVILVYKN